MSSSLLSRLAATTLAVVLTLVLWEASLSWARYTPEGDPLGGLDTTGALVRIRAPGAADAPEIEVDRARFRGLEYMVLIPRWPLALITGPARRVRLVGVHLQAPGEPVQPVPFGGGVDPLAKFLRMTRLLTANVVPRLEAQPVSLALAPPATGSSNATLTTTSVELVPGTRAR